MGGYGAYTIARLDPGRFGAVGAHSAAIGTPGGAPASTTDVIAATANPKLDGRAQLWPDAVAQDPFIGTDQQLAHALHIGLHVWPGGHDFGYWNARWSNYLGFYAHALATCG